MPQRLTRYGTGLHQTSEHKDPNAHVSVLPLARTHTVNDRDGSSWRWRLRSSWRSADPRTGLPLMAARHLNDRRIIGSIGAYTQWAMESDRSARTAAARAGMWRRFLNEVDPDGVLDPADRERRALAARKAFYARLTLLSIQARRRNKGNAA